MNQVVKQLAAGKLILVGTPIGNLSDFSPRGVEALQSCGFIAAEDTRVTLKLLNRFGIKKPLISYFTHNRTTRGEQILDRIEAGETCALVTDAGMPAVSDPGEELVAACRARGIEVGIVPGPSAVVTALAVSGIGGGRFCFEGFLSVNKTQRRVHLNEVKNEKRTLIFYEAPHKLVYTLRDMLEALGERDICICRELTKIYEEIYITNFSKAIERYEQTPPKGEIVLIIKGSVQDDSLNADNDKIEDAVFLAKEYITSGFSKTESAKLTAEKFKFTKREIYNALV